MIVRVVRLVDRRKFEVHLKNLFVPENYILVRPTYISICKADQRYYNFERPSEIMKKKLPMALIHEAVGNVVFDPSNKLKPGTKVVLVPTLSNSKGSIEENYVENWTFCSINVDGFMREIVSHPLDRVVPTDFDIPEEVLSFFELITVAYHSIKNFKKFSITEPTTFGIWGAGNLGYLVSVILKVLYPESRIYVVSKSIQKSVFFSHIDAFYVESQLPSHFRVSHAFECVGGEGSSAAINQIIDVIQPRGTVSLLGVSENLTPINTRMALEKGLVFSCNSRSTKNDFFETLSLIKKNPNLISYFVNLVGEFITIRSLEDVYLAFEVDKVSQWGKTIIKWEF